MASLLGTVDVLERARPGHSRAPLWRHGKTAERDELTFFCSLIHSLAIPLFIHSSKHSSVSVPSAPPSFLLLNHPSIPKYGILSPWQALGCVLRQRENQNSIV